MGRTALIGTFDVLNYGDQLFPYVFDFEIKKRLPSESIEYFGPYGDRNHEIPIESLIDWPVERMLSHFDTIVIGGGDIIRADEEILNSHYIEHPKYSKNHHPLEAMLMRCSYFRRGKNRPNFLWNAPGVHSVDAKFIKKHLENVSYISVRDEYSAEKVSKFAKTEVHVVPDTALLVESMFSHGVVEYQKLKEEFAVKIKGISKGKKVLGFHVNKWFIESDEQFELIANYLMRLNAELNILVVLIPIGICHGDKAILEKIERLGEGEFELYDVSGDPLETAALIGSLDYLVSSSLHANITASSFSVPHLAINTKKWPKTNGFLSHISHQNVLTCWSEFSKEMDRLLSLDGCVNLAHIENAKNIISRHFDIIAKRISKG